MSAGGGSDSGQDFDLNLAPIIDCFTVLITYLLVSASFISLAALEVGVAAVGQGSAAAAVPTEIPWSLTIELKDTREIELKLTGGPQNLDKKFFVAASGANWDLKMMLGRLDEMLKTWPAVKEVTLNAGPTVPYREIVRSIEGSKKLGAKVFLSGS